MTVRAVITGVGRHLPDRVVENEWFSTFLDTSDAWIRERTGIERRRFAAEGELTSDLAIAAGRAALADAGCDAGEVDAVIVATTTPDQTFPSTAVKAQAALGIPGFAYDVMAACAGFVFALGNADALIRSGQARRVLVIGAETYSRILDFEDRGTCVLFGDGAGAVLLEAREGARGILGVDLNSDGAQAGILYVDGGVSMNGQAGKLRMQGREVFRHAVTKLAQTATAALERAGLTHDDIDWVVPHQANIRIIEGTAKKLGTPMDKVVVTVQDHGNTSAASIPLALAHAKEAGMLREGQVLVCEAIGGGLVWGAVALRW
ncbi:MAG: beta-ketoacyl-ACP synthase III [Hasllibacter sp.]